MEFRFILVRPRNPINIGSAARVLANFGFCDLAVVAPYMPHWQEAVSAKGAQDLLKQAKVFKTVADAAEDFPIVLATTTARKRRVEQAVISSPDAPEFLSKLDHASKIAVLFGSEKTGLPKKILDRSDYLLTVPTSPACPSMNLAQAVAVCAYELSKLKERPSPIRGIWDEPIGHKQKQVLVAETAAMFKKIGYLEHMSKEQAVIRLWNLFNQWGIRKRQAALIAGLIRHINRRPSN